MNPPLLTSIPTVDCSCEKDANTLRIVSLLVCLATVLTACGSRDQGTSVNYNGIIGPNDGAAAFKMRESLKTYNGLAPEDKQTLVDGVGTVLPHDTPVTVLSEAFDEKLGHTEDRGNRDCFIKTDADNNGKWVDCGDIVPTSPMSDAPSPNVMLTLDQAQDLAITACQTIYGLTYQRLDSADDEVPGYPNSDQHLVMANCKHPGEDDFQGNGEHVLFIDRLTHKVTTEKEWWRTIPCTAFPANRKTKACHGQAIGSEP